METDQKQGSNPTGDVFGYEDFWQTSYARFQGLFDALRQLILLGNDVLAAGDACAVDPVQKLLCNFVRMTVNAACEVIILCGNGCGAGAIKIVRGMYETQWTAEYLRQNPQEAENYLEFGKVIIWRKLQWMRQNHPAGTIGLSAEVIQEIEDNYRNAAPRFTGKNGKVRHRWSEKSIGEIAKCIGKQLQYELPYSIACSIHHSNFEGLTAHFEHDQDSVEFAHPPTERWIERALIAAASNVYFVLKTLNNCCGLGFATQIDEEGNQLSAR